MALYRDIKFNTGTALDSMGALPTITGATFKQDVKGWALETGAGKYVTYDRQLLPNGAFSVVCWVKFKSDIILGTQSAAIISNSLLVDTGLCLTYPEVGGKTFLYLNTSGLAYRQFNYIPKKGEWHCYIFTIPGSSNTDISSSAFFVDTVAQSVSVTGNGIQSARNGYIYVGNGAAGGCLISRIKVYDTVLTQSQIDQEQAEFNRAQIISRSNSGFVLNKPNDLSREVNSVSGNELIVNGGFETWPSTIPTSWNKGTNVVTVNKITNNPYIGSNSIEIVGVGSASATINNSIYQANTFSKDGWYLVSGYVKLSSGSGSAYLGFQNNLLIIIGTSNYIFYSKKIYALAGNSFNISCDIGSTYQFDNVSVKPLTGLIFATNMQPRGTTLVDISGNGNNGVVSNCVRSLNGLMFNGVNSAITTANLSAFGTNDFTFSCRIRVRSIGTEYAIFGGSTNSFGLLVTTGGYLKVDKINSISLTISTSNIPANAWVTIIYTRTGTVGTYYINGVQDRIITDNTNYSGANNLIAQYSSGYKAYFNGEIADIRIHNRLLSASEIKAYHNSFINTTFSEDFSTLPVGTLNV